MQQFIRDITLYRLIGSFYGIKKRSEQEKVVWSFLYLLTLLTTFFILRPIRDEVNMIKGVDHMPWLFSQSFLGMLIAMILLGYFLYRYRIRTILMGCYSFFLMSIVLFYIFFRTGWYSEITLTLFFIWSGVFNVFTVSLFWSLMLDIFAVHDSKRIFGCIAAGGSIGAITGSLIVGILADLLGMENLILLAAVIIAVGLLILKKILEVSEGSKTQVKLKIRRKRLLDVKTILNSIKPLLRSRYLQGVVLFIMLYTGMTTFLYFEQANLLENMITHTIERIQYFSSIDLATNLIAITGQLFLTHRIIGKYGLALTLCSIPLILSLGFIILSVYTVLGMIGFLLIVNKAGNYILLRPGRELLFTVCTVEEKYKTKSFMDTVVYRGGDLIFGWIFSGLISVGFDLSLISMMAIPLAITWAYTGFRLGKRQLQLQKQHKT